MIWLFLKDYNKSSKDFKRLYLHEKKNDSRWFLFNLFYLQRMLQFIKEKNDLIYFYLQKILQHIFIYGLMFF